LHSSAPYVNFEASGVNPPVQTWEWLSIWEEVLFIQPPVVSWEAQCQC
jgi:hypothetical protein